VTVFPSIWGRPLYGISRTTEKRYFESLPDFERRTIAENVRSNFSARESGASRIGGALVQSNRWPKWQTTEKVTWQAPDRFRGNLEPASQWQVTACVPILPRKFKFSVHTRPYSITSSARVQRDHRAVLTLDRRLAGRALPFVEAHVARIHLPVFGVTFSGTTGFDLRQAQLPDRARNRRRLAQSSSSGVVGRQHYKDHTAKCLSKNKLNRLSRL
jgi:hypothetical protein